MCIRRGEADRRKALALAPLLALLTAAVAYGVATYEFATPLFGLATAPDGSLLVADAGAEIVELRHEEGSLVAALPGVTDVAPIGRGDMFATRGGGPGLTTGALFRVSRGSTREIADLYAFEKAVNPHPAAVDSNPFDVEVLSGGAAVVADAARVPPRAEVPDQRRGAAIDRRALRLGGSPECATLCAVAIRLFIALAIGFAYPYAELWWACRPEVDVTEACVWTRAFLPLSRWVEPLIVSPIIFGVLTLGAGWWRRRTARATKAE